MTIATSQQTALETRSMVIGRWLEIEGLPYTYGTFAASGSWFSARAAADKFLGIRRSLFRIPRGADQTIDTLEGGNKTAGATEFEIVDIDTLPTSWANQTAPETYYILNASGITKASTTIDLNSVTSLIVGQYLYLGTETIKITAINVGLVRITVDRGQFRSKAQAFPTRFPVVTVPWVMANRRCWYNEVIDSSSTDPGTVSAVLDPDRIVRFSGVIKGYGLKANDHATYILRLESLDRELDLPVFNKIRNMDLSTGSLKDEFGDEGTGTAPGWPGYSLNFGDFGIDSTIFPDIGELVLFKIDDEVLAGEVVDLGYARAMRYTDRALLGSRAEPHKQGSRAQEIVPVIAYNSAGTTIERASKFTSSPTTGSPLPADHPLMLLLQLILSTGEGTNTSGSRSFDVLPEGWGLGIDIARVDVAGIVLAGLEEPSLRFNGVIEAGVNFIDFMRQMLTFAGYYFFVGTGDQLTIRRLRPPVPDRRVRTLTGANRIRNQFAGWDGNLTGAVRQVVFKYGWDFIHNKYKCITIINLDLADIYSKGLARTLTFESKLMYPGGSGIPGDSPFKVFDVNAWLFNRADFYESRYGRPPPIITEVADYSFLSVDPGDLIEYTHANLPNTGTGTRGLTAEICEVLAKSVDDDAHVVNLTLLFTGYRLGDYRYISPSAIVKTSEFTWNGGTKVLTLTGLDNENSFTDPITGNSDREIVDVNGTAQNLWDTSDFAPNGMSVQLWKNDFSAVAHGYVTSAPAGSIIVFFPVTPSWTPIATDILTWGYYEDATGAQPPKDIFGFAGDDADPTSLNSDRPANKLFPA